MKISIIDVYKVAEPVRNEQELKRLALWAINTG